MATTSRNGFRYPAPTDAPDAPGAIYNLASDLDNYTETGAWTPSLGGSGASLGTGGTASGTWSRVGQEAVLRGQFTFGSGATFGGGTPVVGGLPRGIIVATATGTGHYAPSSAFRIGMFYLPANNSQFAIWRVSTDGNLASATALGSPATGTLVFALFATIF